MLRSIHITKTNLKPLCNRLVIISGAETSIEGDVNRCATTLTVTRNEVKAGKTLIRSSLHG